MRRAVSRFLHLSTIAVGATGTVWAYVRYVWSPGPEPEDPELLLEWTGQHAAEPLVRTLHLFAAPVLVFAVGYIWSSHIAPRLLRRWQRRATGLGLALLFAPMVLSGVALQTASTPEARDLWVWVHGLSSSAWLLGYLAHQLPRRVKREATS